MNNITKSYIALIIGSILIAFSPVLIKLSGAPGTITMFYRMVFGSLALLIPFLISRLKSKNNLSQKGIWYAICAGLMLAIDMALWATGIMASNAAMPTLVGNLAPLWVGIGSVLIFKEKQSKQFWFGLLMALSGVSFLVLRDFYIPNGIFTGLILGLLAGIFYAGFMLLTQPGRKHLDTISFLFISTLSTAIFLGLFAVMQNLPFTGYSTKVWTIFIIKGLLLQAGAWFLINFAQGYVPASLVSPTLLTQPVVAAVLAFFMLNEVLGLWHVIGGIVVVVGIYVVHFGKR